ncbi:nucleotide-binding protein [Arthrobacter sp. SD76]|uniref:nucleotide-binding protein n=1 Tax=Arthrobacter sp. SD76 TaxID=3415007 RepID=UPI003C7326FF
MEPWLATDDMLPSDSGIKNMESPFMQWATTSVVLSCLTRKNMTSDWLAQEAGFATQEGKALIIPLCLDFHPSELRGALAGFQATSLDPKGIRHLVHALNDRSDSPIRNGRVEDLVDIWAPRLFEEISHVLQTVATESALESAKELKLIGPSSSSKADDVIRELAGQVEALAKQVQELQSSKPGQGKVPSVTGRLNDAKPRIFIGSSVEGLPIAETIQAGLDYVAECTVWNQGVFQPSQTAIETLVEGTASYDCAVIVLTADDIVTKRETRAAAPRDNLIFELGLFTGYLGRAKTFMVLCRDEELSLPSDLSGVTALDFANRSDKNLAAALSPVCLRIKEVMGIR